MSFTKKIISLLIFTILAFGASAWGSYVTNLYKEPWYSMIIKLNTVIILNLILGKNYLKKLKLPKLTGQK